MAKDGEKVAVGLGLAVLFGGVIYGMTRKVEAKPVPPPPGLANLHGKVTDAATGKAIPSVLVLLDSLESHTDSKGNYIFTSVEPGGYRLEFSKEGYETSVY